MSTIKVDTIATRTGSGNITLSNNVASLTSAGAISGTNLTASGTLGVTGNTTMSGDLIITGSAGSSNNSIDVTYNGVSGIANIQADSSGGNTSITFGTSNSGTVGERLRILPTGGLTFNGDTAAANALDDYEEGTFTPTLVDSAGDLSPNYTFQAGQYTKVGNKVTFALRINSNSHDSDGDQLYVGGLPFAINFTNTSNRSYVPVDGSGLNLDTGSGYYKLVGQLTNTNQSITLLQQGDVVVQNNFRANDLAQTKEIYITGTYFTNS